MPRRDFDAARRAYDTQAPAPVEFVLAGEVFTCLNDPSLGDTFEMIDAPDITVEDFDPNRNAHVTLVRKIARYIQRMLVLEDRPRFDQALYRVPVTHMAVIIEIADYITTEVVNRPTVPPGPSSSGRPESGVGSKNAPAGASVSS